MYLKIAKRPKGSYLTIVEKGALNYCVGVGVG